MSSLQSINGFNLDSDLVQKFLKDYTILAKNGKNIILCWIPSHVGILGNEKADAAATRRRKTLISNRGRWSPLSLFRQVHLGVGKSENNLLSQGYELLQPGKQ